VLHQQHHCLQDSKQQHKQTELDPNVPAAAPLHAGQQAQTITRVENAPAVRVSMHTIAAYPALELHTAYACCITSPLQWVLLPLLCEVVPVQLPHCALQPVHLLLLLIAITWLMFISFLCILCRAMLHCCKLPAAAAAPTCQYLSVLRITGPSRVASSRPPTSGCVVACAHVSSDASDGFCTCSSLLFSSDTLLAQFTLPARANRVDYEETSANLLLCQQLDNNCCSLLSHAQNIDVQYWQADACKVPAA
jgi:hypothetical protein